MSLVFSAVLLVLLATTSAWVGSDPAEPTMPARDSLYPVTKAPGVSRVIIAAFPKANDLYKVASLRDRHKTSLLGTIVASSAAGGILATVVGGICAMIYNNQRQVKNDSQLKQSDNSHTPTTSGKLVDGIAREELVANSESMWL